MEQAYRDLAGVYSLLFPLNDRQRAFFEHLLQTAPVGSVLDVGCGTGEHLSWFSARGLRTWGLEPDESMFGQLERRDWAGPAPMLIHDGVQALPRAIGEKIDLVLLEYGDYDRSLFSKGSPALVAVGRQPSA